MDTLPVKAVFRAYLKALKEENWKLSSQILSAVSKEKRKQVLICFDKFDAEHIAYLMFLLWRSIEIIIRYNFLTKKASGNEKVDSEIDKSTIRDLKKIQKMWFEKISEADLPTVFPIEDFELFKQTTDLFDFSEKFIIPILESEIRYQDFEFRRAKEKII